MTHNPPPTFCRETLAISLLKLMRVEFQHMFDASATRGNEMKHNPPPTRGREIASALCRVRHQCEFAWRKRLELLEQEDAVANSKTHDEMNAALKAWADLMLACVLDDK